MATGPNLRLETAIAGAGGMANGASYGQRLMGNVLARSSQRATNENVIHEDTHRLARLLDRLANSLRPRLHGIGIGRRIQTIFDF
jgi:hypothetical protein